MFRYLRVCASAARSSGEAKFTSVHSHSYTDYTRPKKRSKVGPKKKVTNGSVRGHVTPAVRRPPASSCLKVTSARSLLLYCFWPLITASEWLFAPGRRGDNVRTSSRAVKHPAEGLICIYIYMSVYCAGSDAIIIIARGPRFAARGLRTRMIDSFDVWLAGEFLMQ